MVAVPDRMLPLTDIDDSPTFSKAELALLMVTERARLRMSGPRWLGRLRQPRILISDGGPWIDFFVARARPPGFRR